MPGPPVPPLLPEEQQAFHQVYAKYFQTKRGNFFQSLKVFRGVWDCLQLLCDIWQREMADLESLIDRNQLLPKMLFTAAHARFLTAIELSFSCCIGDAYSILRDGIESLSHAYKIFYEPNLIPTWTNKHRGKTEEKAYDLIFTYNKKTNLYPDKDATTGNFARWQHIRALHLWGTPSRMCQPRRTYDGSITTSRPTQTSWRCSCSPSCKSRLTWNKPFSLALNRALSSIPSWQMCARGSQQRKKGSASISRLRISFLKAKSGLTRPSHQMYI
jgi:hypothetical protein